MTLGRKAFRSVRKNLSFYLVTCFLTVVAVTMLVGALTTANTLELNCEEIYGNLHVEDAQFVTGQKISDEDMLRYEDDFDLLLEEQRYTDITIGDNTIRVFSASSKVNLTWIFETKDGGSTEVTPSSAADDVVYICKKYAGCNNLSIGDEVVIGNEKLTIGGYALRPDYLNTLKDLTETIGDYHHFTTAVVSDDTYEKILRSDLTLTDNTYYSVIFYDSNNINPFRQTLYADYRPVEYFNSDANSRISALRGEAVMLKEEFSSYSIILFALVMVIVAFMLSRIIDGESVNIGTLKALGYKESELNRHYILYALIPSVIGSLGGILTGIPFSRAFCAFFYGDVDSFPYSVRYKIIYMVVAFILPIIFNIMVTVIVTSVLLRKDASVLMKKGKNVKTVRKLFRGSGLRFKTVYMFRVLIGNPVRTLVFIIGMTVASMIILLGGMCQDSQRNVLENVLPDMMGDARYETGLKTFRTGEVENGQTLIDVMFEVPGTSVAFNLIGYDKDNTLLKRESLSGNPLTYGEYYMTSGAAKYYGISAGDDFTFIHRITGVETTITISDIIDNDALRLVLTSKENAARIVGVSPDEYNNILSAVPVDVPAKDILKIADFDSYRDSFEQALATTKVVYAILLTVGIIVCILMINLLSGMLIDENRRNISMLKVLGYHGSEIRQIILRPNHLLLPCCYILAIPITIYMTKLMMLGSTEHSGVYIDVVVKPVTLIMYFFIVVGAYIVSLYFGSRKLDRVDMVESLKQED